MSYLRGTESCPRASGGDAGAGPGAARLSVGPETLDGIIADLDQALKAAR